MTRARTMHVGAEPTDAGASFRVWAPDRAKVEVVFENERVGVATSVATFALEKDPEGYFVGTRPDVSAGARYRLKLDDDETLYPDPASCFQPEGVHGPSELIDPAAFAWTDATFPGVRPHGVVLYEFHCGTFTREGTWRAALRELPRLADLGVTCLEVMPVAAFPGTFGWGYDGTHLFAPHAPYGTPDDFRAFVNEAHRVGLGVILDVVYNHLGPDGNYLPAFAKQYFSPTHHTDWGDAINFDSDGNGHVRAFFVANALYWLREFHLDGFRFDATQAIVDESARHILEEITTKARASTTKTLYVINENEPQHTKLVRPVDDGGYGMDALWNDDFHHAALTRVTGRQEAYYADHPGRAQEFVSAAKYGYLFQGQRYEWQKKRRGSPGLDLPPTAFVHFTQNHDQIANSGRGLRGHALSSPGEWRTLTALLLLMPQTPMLFQGQEYAAPNPFFYFGDHNPELNELIRKGRATELSQFPSVATPAMQPVLAVPGDAATFERCKLDHEDRNKPGHAEAYALTKALLDLRRNDATLARVPKRGELDGAVLTDDAFLLRFFGARADADRLLVVNFGRDLTLSPCPEPLLAPPASTLRWQTLLSTDEPRFGGSGTPVLDTEHEGWLLPGRTAVLLAPRDREETAVMTRVRKVGSSQIARLKVDYEKVT